VVHNQTGFFVTNKSNKLERTSAKIDLDYAFTRYLAVLTTKLDAIVLQSSEFLTQLLVKWVSNEYVDLHFLPYNFFNLNLIKRMCMFVKKKS